MKIDPLAWPYSLRVRPRKCPPAMPTERICTSEILLELANTITYFNVEIKRWPFH